MPRMRAPVIVACSIDRGPTTRIPFLGRTALESSEPVGLNGHGRHRFAGQDEGTFGVCRLDVPGRWLAARLLLDPIDA